MGKHIMRIRSSMSVVVALAMTLPQTAFALEPDRVYSRLADRVAAETSQQQRVLDAAAQAVEREIERLDQAGQHDLAEMMRGMRDEGALHEAATLRGRREKVNESVTEETDEATLALRSDCLRRMPAEF